MRKVLLIVTSLFAAAIVAVAAGLLDFLAKDKQVGNLAIKSLVSYWLTTCLAIWLVANARRRWVEMVMLVVSLCVAWGLAEMGIRLIAPKKAMMRYRGVIASKRYHHIYPASREMVRVGPDGHGKIVKTNEDGLRTAYSREEFLKHDVRIAILGDSFTFGLGVEQDAAFPQVMERRLKEQLRDVDVAVLNAGVNSYSPMLSSLLFDGVVSRYRPTLVLLVLDAGDIADDVRYTDEVKREGAEEYFDIIGSGVPRYYGATYEVLRPYLARVGDYLKYPFRAGRRPRYDFYRFELEIEGVTERNKYFIYRHPLETTRQYFEKSLGHIDAIASRAGEIDGNFVLVVTPRFHHWNVKECPNNLEDGYTRNEPFQYEYFRFFEEMKDQLDYPVYDMLPAFKSTSEFPLVFDSDPHWNERGHEFVARVLVDYLVKNELIQ